MVCVGECHGIWDRGAPQYDEVVTGIDLDAGWYSRSREGEGVVEKVWCAM